ncbi:hypothetical protein G6O69_20540 [Pseudenhygromyxa sp. WMMC2535]|uniref:DUF5692 family protein n=1 Tax=Pseudenhygromyxa sp. WMMC2535 TaxID=2712867 RepID=UPI001595235D|nr:DUF5692 family protein [Pseudenhygromyxa sp. WMMC2535]NVB40243.1 hypothetical protein [Pseudenhygromyxa sp. WMMC2535]
MDLPSAPTPALVYWRRVRSKMGGAAPRPMMLTLYIVGYLIFLVVISEVLTRLPLALGLGFWVLTPLALIPWWLSVYAAAQPLWTAFLWVKLFSVITANLWIAASRRYAGRLSAAAIGVPLYLFLICNILEAVAWDLLHANVLNAMAGVLLVVLTPGWRAFSVEGERPQELRYAVSPGWLASYTLWDLAFVYGNWESVITGQHVAVLGAPILTALCSGGSRYMQARAQTLGLHLMIFASAFMWVRERFDTSAWRDADALLVTQLVSLAAALALAVARREALLGRARGRARAH